MMEKKQITEFEKARHRIRAIEKENVSRYKFLYTFW